MEITIVINFKTYKHGKDALELAKIIERFNKNIIIGVQATDLFLISKKTKLAVFSQHVDYFEKGRNTGYILPEAVKAAGGKGTFLNHSEHKMDFKTLKKTIERCKENRLKTLVFASSLNEAREIEKLKPSYLVYEPPELVAGNLSVSNAKPKTILQIAKILKIPFLVGAGIKDSMDVKKSLELGASGIAISSAVANSKKPLETLRKLFKI